MNISLKDFASVAPTHSTRFMTLNLGEAIEEDCWKMLTQMTKSELKKIIKQ